ncbi:hypothetical protein niasHT_030685 [Heterodera trifolii]|uniref:Uncharacterized protein n=1 Tax=Heterodera trifolii TaxID=157864 RepID=A0ABD2HNU7_9BILA
MKTKAMQEEAEKNEQNFEFVCENEGFRYYKDAKTGRQCCLDSAGFWYILNEEKGAFEPMASNFVAEKQAEKPRPKQDKMQSMLKNVERFGIRFDQHGKPVFPKNEKGHFILPKDEKGSPFFPVDDRSVPIFPWDHEKGMPTFPVDDTDEPIFPRNDQNKPIVPVDENDQPIFPVDKTGTYIFPVDESNCPIPALTVYGTRVVPKDEFGNPVIPRDRDGKALIHIASDGVTPLSMGEWKQWKKYYKEQAQVRNFYQQRQQQQPVAVEPAAAAGVGIGAVNYSAMNSMFHPLNLEQQSAYFAADMEMLQRVRRVRPEDVDLPGQMVGQNSTTDQNAKQTANGQTSLEDREEKRKKLLKAQLKSAKMVVPPAAQIPKKVAEEHKKNGTQPKEEPKKDNGKKKQPQVAERRESSGESGKRGRGSGMSRESNSKRALGNSRKRGRESSGDRGRKTMRRTRSRSVKRRRRDSSSSSYSSTSRSRSRSSRSRSYRRSAKRSPARDRRRDRRRSTSNSSRSSSSSSASSSSQYSSSERSHSQSRSFTSDRDEEEERIRDRIIARTLSTSATTTPAISMSAKAALVKQSQPKDDGVAMDEAMEYGPKPPESLEVSTLNSDMEMSEEEEDEKEQNQQQKQRENELPKVNQRINLKREPSVELLNNVPEEGGKEHEKASPPKKADTQNVAEREILFSALEAQPQDVVVAVEHGMSSPPSKVQPQSVVASTTTNTQQMEKVTTTHRQSIFNVEEALVSGDIELIKQCKEKERERYDQLKLQITELVMKKSVHKWNWTQLREAEKRILGSHTERTLSESSEDEAK